jgi:hypothetical protein
VLLLQQPTDIGVVLAPTLFPLKRKKKWKKLKRRNAHESRLISLLRLCLKNLRLGPGVEKRTPSLSLLLERCLLGGL